MSATDQDLLQRWAEGDSAAGSTLVQRHFSSVFRFFQNKVGSDAEDLVQQTFEACAKQAATVRRPDAFRQFVLGVARNQLLMHYRKAAGKGRSDVEPEELSVERLFPSASPYSVAVRHSEQRLLLRAVRKMPLKHQIVLELRFWEDMSVPEIAEVLGVAEGTAKSRLSRAKGNLRQVIEHMEADPPLQHSTLVGLETWLEELREA